MKINLKGYQITEILYDGNRTLVYRGVKKDEGKSVVIKTLHREYPNFNELLQFRHQYVLTKNLEILGIVKPIYLEKSGNGYVLIMEDVGGISLSEYLRNCDFIAEKNSLKRQEPRGQTQGEIKTEEKTKNLGLSWDLDEFFLVGLSLVEIIEKLHQKRIIHKDIKPGNILINPETKEIFLIDFSIASLLPKESQQLQNPNQLEGTLAYISPEQTGRMNRGIDYRSDFYSLGVTFYEMLAGKLPFESNDAMELVHCHIAKIPTPPHQINPEIPKVVSDIVMKLMAKNAEDRYQSARGIKHDLNLYWEQWQKEPLAIPFELGQRDISDRFTIPEKLYGRETEVRALLDAFDRVANSRNTPHAPQKEGQAEMMLVAGFSGIGKTAVVNEVHKPIVRQRGYFIKGKFDQFNRNIPFSAFVIAFRDLMGQLLGESDAQLAVWKEKILTALGENGQVIVEVIPELELLIGKQPTVAELSGSALQSRFNLLFGKFVRLFATIEHPLTIFLDDLQWADSASLNLLKLLMSDGESGYLLILGAYRDNEVFPAHPLMLALDELQKAEANITTITLAALARPHLRQLVADTLRCSQEAALPLAELVSQKTKGNPFFATQFLKGLHEDGWITFDTVENCWQCDLVRVRELALTDDVVEFMATRLHRLPESTKEILKLAACIGDRFDLGTLAIVSEGSQLEVAQSLWGALQEGLVLPRSETYKFYQGEATGNRQQATGSGVEEIPHSQFPKYKFLHDRVQQAAYSLIRKERQQQTHLKIGRLLARQTEPLEIESNIFSLVSQFNAGLELVSLQTEKEEIARYNLIACRKAKNSAAYQPAWNYAKIGSELLGEQSWQTCYQLTFELYQESAELAYLNGDFPGMEELAEIVFQKAHTFLETIETYQVKIQAYVAQNRLLEGVKIGLNALKSLGVDLPVEPTAEELQQGWSEMDTCLGERAIADLVNLPRMTEPDILATVQILSSLFGITYFAAPNLCLLAIIKQVILSLSYGNAPESAFAYANYGMMKCNILQDIETGYQFGQLALSVLSELNVKNLASKTLFMVNVGVKHWKEKLHDTLPNLTEVYLKSLETGDLEYAAYGAVTYCCYSYLAGKNLKELSKDMETYGLKLQEIKQQSSSSHLKIFGQAVLNLQQKSQEVWQLDGKIYNEEKSLPIHLQNNDNLALGFLYLNKLILTYLFGDYERAAIACAETEKYLSALVGCPPYVFYYFYNSLTQLALYSASKEEAREQIWSQLAANQGKLENWAEQAPMNCQHKYDLVEAERNRVLGQKAEAIEMYDKAISGAKENEYIQEQALANELAAKFYLDWGKEKVAAGYMQEAYYCYAAWGAKAKIHDLEQRYQRLLAPILRGEATRLDSRLTISDNAKETISSTTGAVSVFLDLSSTIKASLLISGEIKLEYLLEKLMQVVMENAGATKGALILPREQSLIIEAFADCSVGGETIHINSVGEAFPLEESEELPISVINNVWRAKTSVLFNGGNPDSKFFRDSYLISSHPQSMLCIPLLNQGKLRGILYLENSFAAGAFTSDRLEVLNVICSQAAVSLENARLYLNLERSEIREREKSERLASSLQQLEEAQLQLVQSEKMATIGQLVAGIAHEINNPVGFISGNLDYASEYIQNLMELLQLYQQGYAPNSEPIKEKIEEIELDYLLEDLPELISSMKEGTNRIAEISKSMRTFSRSDTAEKVLFNLHDGIDSTLLILKHRLKANENRPEIKVVKNYGSLPEVNCYPGQLNQVFMNLIANAIDALEEGNSGRTFEEIKNQENRIFMATEIDKDKQNAIVRIGDSGPGMSEEVKRKIFDHLFTTKGVGKGTGLGLSISRQIVVEKHGGTITCTSELGKGTEFAIALPLT